MTFSYRIIFWIPVALFFILNLTFKLIIFLLQNIGNAIVWCNRKIVKAGDYCTDQAQNNQGIDNWIKSLQQAKDETKKRVDAKRNSK